MKLFSILESQDKKALAAIMDRVKQSDKAKRLKQLNEHRRKTQCQRQQASRTF